MTINRLPNEVLLEVFDSYRQSFNDQYDDQWRKKYAWFNLAHVCRRWRAVVFGSYSYLDLNIVVGPEKPAHIKTFLSGYFKLPILIDYSPCSSGPLREITGSALWRMHAALKCRDRVREISFGGWVVGFPEKFISGANHHFPALESLVLRFPKNQQPYIPDTFLRGPKKSHFPLRLLKLYGGSLSSVSGLLLSATALTDLTLDVSSNTTHFELQESVLIACLQGMQCLCNLDLTIPCYLRSLPHSTPKDMVTLLKLTRFHYSGVTLFLNNLMSGISTPSLQEARFKLCSGSPFPHFSRIIDEVREELRSISVTFDRVYFRLSSSTQLGKIDHFKPSFSFNTNDFPNSMKTTNIPPSTKLAMAEELTLNIPNSFYSQIRTWEPIFSMREFLRQFRSVRVLRVSPFPFVRELGLYLQQNYGEAIFPLLEEIELFDEEYQRRAAEALATFQPFASARDRAGRLVKIHHC